MARRLTVFYSWQSDTPPKLNRNFIEDALREALGSLHSDATLENALRDTTVELDKDTKDVAGSPPIAETILQKIDECAVFVADVTFVGESKPSLIKAGEKPRQFPNPNVMIEYGYALKRHSHTALIAVMNTAFGKPDAESLPFDLRHLRWPITYHLAETTAVDKSDQFESLVEILVKAIGLVLSNHASSFVTSAVTIGFSPQNSTKNAALFCDDPQDLIIEDSVQEKAPMFTGPDKGIAFLRLYPSERVPELETELEAKSLVTKGNLWPMGVDLGGRSIARNKFGAIVYLSSLDETFSHFSQLFLSKELWGVDADSVSSGVGRAYSGGKSNGFIPADQVEEAFIRTLRNYLEFAKATLQLPLPLQIEAGLVGISGYLLGLARGGLQGKGAHDIVKWQGEVAAYDTSPAEILGSFFNRVWANFGVDRPSFRQS